jgi:hypothetical protein
MRLTNNSSSVNGESKTSSEKNARKELIQRMDVPYTGIKENYS